MTVPTPTPRTPSAFDACVADLRLSMADEVMTLLGTTASPTVCEAAALLHALADAPVRDVVLWRLHRGPRAWPRAAVVLLRAMAAAGADAPLAPAASVLAVGAWCHGDAAGARAAVAVALAEDPGYALARLLAECLDAGAPATVWGAVMDRVRERPRGADAGTGTGTTGGAA